MDAAVFRRSPAVEETRVGDRVVLYHRQSGNAIVLNPTATLLWEQLQAETAFDQLAAELSARFADVEHDIIAEDVRVCIAELRTEQLIQQVT